jgi:hypothetical protein
LIHRGSRDGDHLCAFVRERETDGFTDATAGAGDDDDFTGEALARGKPRG